MFMHVLYGAVLYGAVLHCAEVFCTVLCPLDYDIDGNDEYCHEVLSPGEDSSFMNAMASSS